MNFLIILFNYLKLYFFMVKPYTPSTFELEPFLFISNQTKFYVQSSKRFLMIQLAFVHDGRNYVNEELVIMK